jgi:hypothetical protein
MGSDSDIVSGIVDPAARHAADVVTTSIAAADRRRRGRAASRQLWRAAPVAAAILLGIAGAGYWAGWPAALPLVAVAIAFLALVVYSIVSRRARPISDAVAAAIDDDARLGGELRSARWFAARGQRDAWAELHVDRAAARLRGIDWADLYPPVRARRARIATSLMIAATIAIAIVLPGRVLNSSASVRAAQGRDAHLPWGQPLTLTPELLKQLEDLLAAAEAGTLAAPGTLTNTAEMGDLLKRLRELRDREILKDLAKAMNISDNQESIEELMNLAERTRRASDAKDATREFREAMDQLARNLTDAANAEIAESGESRTAASTPGRGGEPAEGAELDDASIQAIQEAQGAAGGAGAVMMSNPDAQPGASMPGVGVGGSGSSNAAASAATTLEQALRQETIEASRDSSGANVEAEVRRMTEQAQASAAFTRGAAAKSDKSRAAAPPPVPEGRRSGVQRYFIRKQ